MSLKIKYGAYTFPITPTFEPKESVEFDEAENRKGIQIDWPTEGYLKADGPDALNVLLNELKTALSVDNKNLQLLKEDNTVLQEVRVAECFKGPRVELFEITEPRQALYATNIRFRVSFSAFKATERVSDQLLRWDYSRTWIEDRFGLLTVIDRGLVQTSGISARNQAKSIKFDKPKGVFLDAPLSFDIDANEDDTEAKYSATQGEFRKEYPRKVKDGTVAINSEIDSTGTIETVTVTGFFAARDLKDAEKAARDLKPKKDLITERIETNEHEGRCSFSYAYEEFVRVGSALVSFEEVIIILSRIDYPVFHRMATLKTNPVKQILGRTTWKATQSGRAVGRNFYPRVPSPAYGHALLNESPRVSYSSPKRQGTATWVDYPISWSYSFEDAIDQYWVPPGKF